MIYKLLTQEPLVESLDVLVEEVSKDKPSNMYLTGTFMVSEERNKNKRIYSREEMSKEVERFNKELISERRALCELEHPESATINPERACDLIVELKMDGNVARGKSKVLRTPMGLIVRSLIEDGVKLGKSSRALGQLEERSGTNHVKNMKLITVDTVADPSAPGAFVNGILESKQYVLNDFGLYEEMYDKFEGRLKNLPRKDLDGYLRKQILNFISSIK